MNSVCIIGHQIHKEHLKGSMSMSIGNTEKIPIHSKQAYALRHNFMFFLLWPYYYRHRSSGRQETIS